MSPGFLYKQHDMVLIDSKSYNRQIGLGPMVGVIIGTPSNYDGFYVSVRYRFNKTIIKDDLFLPSHEVEFICRRMTSSSTR